MDQNNNSSKTVVFEGEESFASRSTPGKPTPKIIAWVVRNSGGYIKDGRQAAYVLVGFVVLSLIISLFLFTSGGAPGAPSGELYYGGPRAQ